MKRAGKVIAVLIMISGILFSISNFISLELKAGGGKGSWVFCLGTYRCMGDGNECSFGIGQEPN